MGHKKLQNFGKFLIAVGVIALITIIGIGIKGHKQDLVDSQHSVEGQNLWNPNTGELIEEKPEPTYWNLDYFTDDFGDKTHDKFLKYTTTGTFSNSATRGSHLYVRVKVTRTAVGIDLFEYRIGRSAEKFIGGGKVMMKNSDGKRFTSGVRDWNHSGGLALLSPKDCVRFLKKSVGEVKVTIQDDYSSTYYFKINVTGLVEKIKEL